MEPIVKESVVTLVKVNDDYSDDIIGTWEGRCTSEGAIFDDGQDHRWEYKDDGTFVYYVKNGDDWVPSEDTMNTLWPETCFAPAGWKTARRTANGGRSRLMETR